MIEFKSETQQMVDKANASIISEQRERIAELEEVLTLVKKDLLMRAEEDSDGCKVVDLSSSIWIKLKEALKEQGE